MKQLSGSDNRFLSMERGNQMAHVAALAIYDPSTAPGGHVRFKGILSFFERRLNAAKRRPTLPRHALDLTAGCGNPASPVLSASRRRTPASGSMNVVSLRHSDGAK
jgi:hypothetical protein